MVSKFKILKGHVGLGMTIFEALSLCGHTVVHSPIYQYLVVTPSQESLKRRFSVEASRTMKRFLA